ncbi:hypothetical protein GCM10010924_13600 [Rhizobium wenxiniae]|uniref:Na+/melibiose symporter-like transporter n=1 Tax=Rhizobium wenxiniae TaxID=1737357 RepID=A0A7W9Y3A2_9HYPH|nr:hypothetical protein [Rhizobium wenxiniae]MBB6161209.1 Na+/melibiose symporter-like transporter [Rhizobium wenxiniae]GGF87149.1 hypothetical protein GCM10010924_13600 [Rhizobium wenxiniae]
MKSYVESEVSQRRLLDAEKRFNFKQQINRSDTEAKAQVAEKIIRLACFSNAALFVIILISLGFDQSNLAKGYYFSQIVSDRLLGWLVAGIVLEVAAAFCCFVCFSGTRRRDVDR